jgi:hypothetical protein
MTHRQEQILSAIRAIGEEKRSQGTLPAYSTTIELARRTGMSLTEVTDTVHGLEALGVLKVGPTLSYEYCEIIDGNDANK